MVRSITRAETLGRLAGLFAILLLADFLAILFVDPHNTLHANPSSQYAIS